jgi:hypothetical protein
MNRKPNIFLIGAGLSIDGPSCIPAAWPIIRTFCSWLADGDGKLEQELLTRCYASPERNPFDFIRFEGLMQAIARTMPDIVGALQVLEAWGMPNAFHLTLMKMAQEGDVIVTTNFDTRFEQASEWLDFPLKLFRLSKRSQLPSPGTQLVKLHGSFPYRHRHNNLPRATLNQIGTIGLGFENFPRFRRWFTEQSVGANLYVMGYSASDSFDVVPFACA